MNGGSIRPDGFAAAHAAEQNHLLAALPLAEYAAVLPQLVPTHLRLKQVLFEPDQPIKDVYFVRDGVGSLIAIEDGRAAVEVGLIGNEGFIGLPILFGVESTPNRLIVQVEGEAWRVTADSFRNLLEEHAALRRVCLRYAQYFNVQMGQSVACNRLHAVEERCARWLLMTLDRLQEETFNMTHEFLAIMLGVRRAGVTVAMGALQGAGIIKHTRGRVAILDRARLEGASCHCYQVTRVAFDQLIASA